jgi:chromate transporter
MAGQSPCWWAGARWLAGIFCDDCPTTRRKRAVQHTGTTDHGRSRSEAQLAPIRGVQMNPRPTLWQIFGVFARYANFTLGGGSATTAVMHDEIVSKRHWVGEEQFGLSFALGRLTPGTNLLAFCVGIGWILRGWWGAVVALLASSVPCTILVVAITVLFSTWQENPYAQAAIRGAVAAAVAIMVKTVWTIAHPHYKPGNRLRVVLTGATAFALHAVFGLSPITVLVLAAGAGAIVPEPRR